MCKCIGQFAFGMQSTHYISIWNNNDQQNLSNYNNENQFALYLHLKGFCLKVRKEQGSKVRKDIILLTSPKQLFFLNGVAKFSNYDNDNQLALSRSSFERI